MKTKQFIGYLLFGVGVLFPIIEVLRCPFWEGCELIVGRALLYLFLIVFGLILVYFKEE